MLNRFRTHFGTAGLVVAIVALIAALAGGAIAANSGGGKATASAKKAKKGPRGPRGPAGAKGDKGDTGSAGSNGSNGAAGTAGAAGPTGPTGATGAAGAPGAKGATGAIGATGSPWTLGGTLPPNATETGAWTLPIVAEGGVPGGVETFNVPMSFAIPLAAELDAEHVHVINEAGKEVFFEGEPKEVTSTECLGTVADPEATSGNLCVYVGSLSEGASPGGAFAAFKYLLPIQKASAPEPGASTAGAVLRLHVVAKSTGYGTYAVTG